MHSEIHNHKRKFYDKYWEQRKKEGYLQNKNNMLIAERIKIAVDMIIRDSARIKDKKMYILDIGCGEGALGKLLKERLKERVFIIGCDIADTALKEVSDDYSDVFQIDVETDKLMDKFSQYKFDYIVILEVLEHLFKPESVLQQCSSILKDDGYLIASFPNINWYRYRIDMLKGHFPKNYLLCPGEHIQNFTLYSFNTLLTQNRFTPIEIDAQFIAPRVFRPVRLFKSIFKKFPNLFGYQIVIRSKKEKK